MPEKWELSASSVAGTRPYPWRQKGTGTAHSAVLSVDTLALCYGDTSGIWQSAEERSR